MNLDFRLAGHRFVKIEQNTNTCKNEEPLEETTTTNNIVIPEAKPITASIEDFLDNIAMGRIQMLTTTNSNILTGELKNGVSKFLYKNSDITTYNRNGQVGVQIIGSVSAEEVLNNIPALKKAEAPIGQKAEGSNNIDGDVDDGFEQGNTGDCWVLTGTLALASTEIGKQIIKNAIRVNEDGSVTVNFKGIGVSYTISAEEIAKHDTDGDTSDAYSNGDNDMLVIELAVAKLVKDIAAGKVKLDVDPESYEGYYNEDGSIEGGFGQTLIYYFTGQTADTHIVNSTTRWGLAKGLPENEVLEVLKNAYETGNTALTFGIYYSPHEATLIDGSHYSLNISGGHALAITNLTETTVTFVNPWDSTTEYTMTWEEFAGMGIGMISVTDLNSLASNDEVDVDDNTDGADDIDGREDIDGDDGVDGNDGVDGDDDVTPTPPVNPDDNDDSDSDNTDGDDSIDGTDDVDGPDDIDNPDEPKEAKEAYNLITLRTMGFSSEEINLYFDRIEEEIDSPLGKYKQLTFTLKDGIEIPYYNGEIKDALDLANVLGVRSKRMLRTMGLTDEVITKYFTLTPSDRGSIAPGHAPIYEYNINSEFISYNIVKTGDTTRLILRREDKTALVVTIRPDGTYEEDEMAYSENKANKISDIFDRVKCPTIKSGAKVDNANISSIFNFLRATSLKHQN